MAPGTAQISLYLLLLILFSKTDLTLSLRYLKPNPNGPSNTSVSIADVHDLLPKYGPPKGSLTQQRKLSYGAVSDVSGIQAKKLFIWVSVTGIHRDKGSDSVEFYVGALSEKLPAKQFEDIPECKNKACHGVGSGSVESI
ncbi:uncharacterized protein LOC103954027 [Pyrus x bretschneideri]|uniref:uncharacterized protein LOC103954027 n=1 Tax=Pyrus x bretschneideri TaxID=225117 RepID=UPI002030E267|nr:uncharacterized protein LOC103954027 [Pyrus x bretschneideri]